MPFSFPCFGRSNCLLLWNVKAGISLFPTFFFCRASAGKGSSQPSSLTLVFSFQVSFSGCALRAFLWWMVHLLSLGTVCRMKYLSCDRGPFQSHLSAHGQQQSSSVLWSVCSPGHLLLAALYPIQSSAIGIMNGDNHYFSFQKWLSGQSLVPYVSQTNAAIELHPGWFYFF